MYDNVNVAIGNSGDFTVDGSNPPSCDFFFISLNGV